MNNNTFYAASAAVQLAVVAVLALLPHAPQPATAEQLVASNSAAITALAN